VRPHAGGQPLTGASTRQKGTPAMIHDPPRLPRLAFTVAEAADVLSLSRTELYRLVKRGEIRARRCGRRLLISRRALEQYVEGEAS
jgi:excisionase family DNA binding protein